MAPGSQPVRGPHLNVNRINNRSLTNSLLISQEVEDFFNDMDRDFDQRLSFEEFLGEESHIEKVFKSMDRNGDGFVTKEEFHNVCKNLTEEQVALAFSQFDTSGDDKLNYKEFCLMIIQREQERSSSHSQDLNK